MRPEPSLASYLDADCTKSVLTPIVESLKDDADILEVKNKLQEQTSLYYEGKLIDYLRMLNREEAI